MQKVTLQVEGMSCGHCVSSVEKAVKLLGASATVNLEKKAVVIEFNEAITTVGAIKEAIADQGYSVF
jgi:copper chaperone